MAVTLVVPSPQSQVNWSFVNPPFVEFEALKATVVEPGFKADGGQIVTGLVSTILATGDVAAVHGTTHEMVAFHPALLTELSEVNLKVKQPSGLDDVTVKGTVGVPAKVSKAAPVIVAPCHISK